ncbi:hypothetical protein [Methylobacterium nodulans]|uniref:hypothetical protein n=1 Tax=Methylobacterium nodulans TaxID=114616 RepID=UPI0002FF575D|nr:hypothetical protein [Methylobacterium nodulans]
MERLMTETDEARWLALCAAVRALAMHAARAANPAHPADWLASVALAADGLVNAMTNPHLTEEELEKVTQATETTLRLIFDQAVFPVREA